MPELQKSDASIFKYEFEVPLKKNSKVAWEALTSRINDWWMADFRVLGEDSVVTLTPEPGGGIVESNKAGDALEWYRVQMCSKGKSLYLVGYLAADWGGPTISMLKLEISSDGATSILKVSDALLGNVSDQAAKNAKEGWFLLFGKGYRTYVATAAG